MTYGINLVDESLRFAFSRNKQLPGIVDYVLGNERQPPTSNTSILLTKYLTGYMFIFSFIPKWRIGILYCLTQEKHQGYYLIHKHRGANYKFDISAKIPENVAFLGNIAPIIEALNT